MWNIAWRQVTKNRYQPSTKSDNNTGRSRICPGDEDVWKKPDENLKRRRALDTGPAPVLLTWAVEDNQKFCISYSRHQHSGQTRLFPELFRIGSWNKTVRWCCIKLETDEGTQTYNNGETNKAGHKTSIAINGQKTFKWTSAVTWSINEWKKLVTTPLKEQPCTERFLKHTKRTFSVVSDWDLRLMAFGDRSVVLKLVAELMKKSTCPLQCAAYQIGRKCRNI